MDFGRAFGRAWLRLYGWRVNRHVPDVQKAVIIASPHTSNWDFPHTMAFGLAMNLRIHWMGKHTMFKWPFRSILRRLGGVPVDRRAPGGLVEQMTEQFRIRDRFWLVVPPKGTRAPRPYWKSGFYNIAQAAGVPIMLGYLDFGAKEVGLGLLVHPTGDVRRDMDQIRAFYAGKMGKRPELHGRVRLRAEDEGDADASAPLANPDSGTTP
ncbi:MAG: lysophospholipid acyltransferase family protein [Myxococcales bacterium]|nr:lysophospholipid acyltransferase family protein [Myxococcales bacterium]